MKHRVIAGVCALLCASAAFAPLAARADVSEASALQAGLLAPVNASLQRALQDIKKNEADKAVAQANPVGTPERPLRKPSLPQGFTYNVDVSFAYPVNNPGFNAGDPGGMDAGFGYAFSHTQRVTAGYYEIQQVPVGLDRKSVV